jgi:hypothetical protein
MDQERFIHRTLKADPTPEEQALSGALIRILSQSIHDLPGIVTALNATDVKPVGGAAWDEQTFRDTVARLGAYPNSVGGPLGSHTIGNVPPGNSSSARPSDRKGV